MPTFWVGLLLIILFAVTLRWFPVGGIGTGPLEPLRSLVLPAFAVSLGLIPPLVRSLRAALLDVFSADFVTTLRAAGIPERRVVFGHILRNASLPTITLLSVSVSYLIGGTLVVEQVFGINGLGTLLFNAIGNRDFPLVQGIALYCALMVVIVSLVLDFVVYRLDPRTRNA
jgi:peptide/nickel transport system permease protein